MNQRSNDFFLSKLEFRSAGRWLLNGPRALLEASDPEGPSWWEKSVQFVETAFRSPLRSWTQYRPFNEFSDWSVLRECIFLSDAFENARTGALENHIEVRYWKSKGIRPNSSPAISKIAAAVAQSVVQPAKQPSQPIVAEQPSRIFEIRAQFDAYFAKFQWFEGETTTHATRAWTDGLSELRAHYSEAISTAELIERFDREPLQHIDLSWDEIRRFGTVLAERFAAD